MASSMIRLAGGRRAGWLSSLWVVALVLAGATQAWGALSYQIRLTEHSPNAARQRHVACLLGDGRVGVFAGLGRADVEIFDPATEQFLTSRAVRLFADFAGLALPDGQALLVDGQNDCVFDYLVEQYVDVQRTYPGGYVRFPVLTLLPDGKVFVCGGEDADFLFKGDCGVFDPRSLQFLAAGDLVVPRAYHSAISIDDRQVLIAGGYGIGVKSSAPAVLDSLELFDIAAKRSVRMRTTLQYARYSHCCVRLPDGRILFLGGTGSETDYWLRSVEIFDPNTSAVVAGPDLGLGRSGARTAVLPSGRIAVFGGNYDARAIEIYRPDTGTFELAPVLMIEPRWTNFTATSLESGAVLLVGGRVNGGNEVAQNAEIFEETTDESPAAPAMTEESIRALLTDSDSSVVNDAIEWLVDLGPQVKPILETLVQDASADLSRQATSIVQAIDARDYPEIWCVEVWDAEGRQDAIWLDNFDSPDQYNAANPDQHIRSILRVIEEADFTHLVVRFPTYAPYETRVKLFNLVGWTRVPHVVLGETLSEEELSRVVGPTVR